MQFLAKVLFVHKIMRCEDNKAFLNCRTTKELIEKNDIARKFLTTNATICELNELQFTDGRQMY